MNRKFLSTQLAGLLMLVLSGCYYTQDTQQDSPRVPQVALKPVYMPNASARQVYMSAPVAFNRLGKIYYYNNFIFINEQSKGVHIIDNTDPAAPKRVAFLNIIGCTDIVIKNNLLYANNLTDLVVVDMATPQQATLVNRVENAFSPSSRPAQTDVRFICPDTRKGVVVGWEVIVDEEEKKLATCF